MSESVNTGDTPAKRGIDISRLDWPVVIGIVGMHLVALTAPLFFTWSGLAAAFVMYLITGGLGVTLCFHRLLTHRSFKTYKPVEYFLTICGCLAWQGGPAHWVGIHRLHHANSDEDLDPHSPKHGFTWAHMFWCMHKDCHGRNGLNAANDLLRQRGHRLINRYFYVPQFLMIPVLYGLGMLAAHLGYGAQREAFWGLSYTGLSWVVWGSAVRVVAVYHFTWFVNSAAHTWGYRNFETTDLSTNNWWVALLSFGEGWHNNHHAYQRSAAHGLRWYEFDLTYIMIRAMGLVGLAWDIKHPAPEEMPGQEKAFGTDSRRELTAQAKPEKDTAPTLAGKNDSPSAA